MPILFVQHEHDGDWQFLGGATIIGRRQMARSSVGIACVNEMRAFKVLRPYRLVMPPGAGREVISNGWWKN
ncbi:MAG: hypothetical protein KTR21_10305 [Rhodobacteraceae bacterium]|nr:hypothetical protein [Paracoccaceae bacterium]